MFDIKEEGRVSAMAAATHSCFKLKWLKCLTPSAQNNVFSALKDAFLSITEESNEEIPLRTDDNNFFIFQPHTQKIPSTKFLVDHLENIYQKFTSKVRSDLEPLNSYPTMKRIYYKV